MRTVLHHSASFVCVCLLSVGVSRATDWPVTAKVNGKAENIGTLTGLVDLGGVGPFSTIEYGEFKFDAKWKDLDTCCDFRWYQIFTYDDHPGALPGGTVLKTPYVDPPAGGYDYQQPKGADKTPFYENDDDGNTYYFSNFKDTHIEKEKSWTYDSPGLGLYKNGEKMKIETYLCGYGEGIEKEIGKNKFDVLWGFSWELGVDGTGAKYAKLIDEIKPAAFDLKNLKLALDNSGFNAWDVVTGTDYKNCIPEPASIVLLVLSVACTALRSRRAA